MKDLKNIVKSLRKNLQEPEKILWSKLRDRRFKNYKFRRQVQIGKYIVDFVCYEKQLIIELDGRQHLTPENLKNDEIRTKYLEERTFKVIRYYNTDILNNIESVMQDLWDKLQ